MLYSWDVINNSELSSLLSATFYDLFNFSERSHKSLYINTSQVICLDIQKGVMWNVARQTLNIPDNSMPVSLFKNKLITENKTLGDYSNGI